MKSAYRDVWGASLHQHHTPCRPNPMHSHGYCLQPRIPPSRFGTLHDYFAAVEASLHRPSSSHLSPLHSLSGDFFTYSDVRQDYWTGYFTTRPFWKATVRQLEATLRAADILYALSAAVATTRDTQSGDAAAAAAAGNGDGASVGAGESGAGSTTKSAVSACLDAMRGTVKEGTAFPFRYDVVTALLHVNLEGGTKLITVNCA